MTSDDALRALGHDSLDGTVTSMTSLLLRHESDLNRILRREGRGVLRYERASDLAQGVRLRALKARDRLEYRSESEFLDWLMQVARQHVASRSDFWRARKRAASRLIRIISSDLRDSSTRGAVHPASSWSSASSFAERKEHFAVAVRAVSILMPVDQEIVEFLARGLSIGEIAAKLGVEYQAAEQARLRTLERFHKAFRLLYGQPGG